MEHFWSRLKLSLSLQEDIDLSESDKLHEISERESSERVGSYIRSRQMKR